MTKRYKDKEYRIHENLIKEYGSIEKVLESRTDIEFFRGLSERKFNETISLILEAPKNTLNWEHNIAMLIGTARVHRDNRDIYTIKEI